MRWRVILPVKPDDVAKTRLRTATASTVRHAELVTAIQRDTIDAVLSASAAALEQLPGRGQIVGVHVVGGGTLAAELAASSVPVSADPGLGLNDALSQVAAELSLRWPGDAVVAMVADLPALRPQEILDLLALAGDVRRGIVVDAAGTGTTMLTVLPGEKLEPSFGLDSAARHQRSGAAVLAAGPGARADVDTADDLQRCLQLGVGQSTARMVAYLV